MNDPKSNLPDDGDVVGSHDELMRAPGQSREGTESFSPWLVLAFLGITFLGAGYLFWNSGGFQANVYNPARVSWSGDGGAVAAAPDPKVLGKKVFTQTCAVCHQANGMGVPGQFPPLAGSEWVLDKDWAGDNHLVKIVLNGLQGMVTVEGKPYNNTMTPWGGVLKDEQIAAVLTYVRSEWGNDAPAISAEFVAQVREANKDRKEPWTQKELQAIEKQSGSAAAPAPGGAEAPAAPAAGGNAEAPAATPGT